MQQAQVREMRLTACAFPSQGLCRHTCPCMSIAWLRHKQVQHTSRSCSHLKIPTIQQLCRAPDFQSVSTQATRSPHTQVAVTQSPVMPQQHAHWWQAPLPTVLALSLAVWWLTRPRQESSPTLLTHSPNGGSTGNVPGSLDAAAPFTSTTSTSSISTSAAAQPLPLPILGVNPAEAEQPDVVVLAHEPASAAVPSQDYEIQELEMTPDELLRQAVAVNTDIGRVVLVARRVPNAQTGSQAAKTEDAYFKQLVENTKAGPCGGLMLLYRSCVLLVIEGGNYQVLGMLRRLTMDDPEQHGLSEPRVVSFVVDARSRLFPSWATAEVKTRKAIGVALVMTELQWATAVRGVEAFIRAAGTRLQGLSQTTKDQALRDPAVFFGDLTPETQTVLSLAAAGLGPTLDKFLEVFDMEWPRYKQACEDLVEAGWSPEVLATVPEWCLLHAVYGPVYDLELKRQQQAEPAPSLPKESPLAHLYPKKRETPSS